MDQGQVSGAPQHEEDEGDQVQAGQGVGSRRVSHSRKSPQRRVVRAAKARQGIKLTRFDLAVLQQVIAHVELDDVGDQDDAVGVVVLDAVQQPARPSSPRRCWPARGVKTTRDGTVWKPSRSISLSS